ncbi:unnamed protein product [Paramecium sonneborni]|uniref:Uncharacterized protein n=1 Tax=Paramecium sonneborni TaxID=65129 RepID=A0A8S1JRX3_9CILI|nr:unnamed protein product [Paramecium sonneborni]
MRELDLKKNDRRVWKFRNSRKVSQFNIWTHGLDQKGMSQLIKLQIFFIQ